jgi:glucosyl-dolichyl phosphate glucuronosyltransferase
MQLDVILTTCNRQELLKQTLKSLLTAEVPPGLDVHIAIVDNNSKDQTRQIVHREMDKCRLSISYIFEGRQGKSYALNTGIRLTNGPLVAMVDDDEEIDRHWYSRIHSAFADGKVDFIGGPYVPRWGAPPPAWLPNRYSVVIGSFSTGDKVLEYGEGFPGILLGGNAVLTRSILREAGPYSTLINRTQKRLLTGEDQDMYLRLLAIGARGLYFPDLIVYHYISPEKLTKRYFRRFCFWRGVSRYIIERRHSPSDSYMDLLLKDIYNPAARGLFRSARTIFSKEKDPAQTFTDELSLWYFAGFLYGHFY